MVVDLVIALVCGVGAFVCTLLAHNFLPEWEPSGYTVIYTYTLGTAILLGWFAVWAALVADPVPGGVAFAAMLLITAEGGAGTLWAYGRRYRRGAGMHAFVQRRRAAHTPPKEEGDV